MDDGYQCPPPTIVAITPRQYAAYQDAAIYWYGLTTGYVLTLLTLAAILAALRHLGGRAQC